MKLILTIIFLCLLVSIQASGQVITFDRTLYLEGDKITITTFDVSGYYSNISPTSTSLKDGNTILVQSAKQGFYRYDFMPINNSQPPLTYLIAVYPRSSQATISIQELKPLLNIKLPQGVFSKINAYFAALKDDQIKTIINTGCKNFFTANPVIVVQNVVICVGWGISITQPELALASPYLRAYCTDLSAENVRQLTSNIYEALLDDMVKQKALTDAQKAFLLPASTEYTNINYCTIFELLSSKVESDKSKIAFAKYLTPVCKTIQIAIKHREKLP